MYRMSNEQQFKDIREKKHIRLLFLLKDLHSLPIDVIHIIMMIYYDLTLILDILLTQFNKTSDIVEVILLHGMSMIRKPFYPDNSKLNIRHNKLIYDHLKGPSNSLINGYEITGSRKCIVTEIWMNKVDHYISLPRENERMEIPNSPDEIKKKEILDEISHYFK